ncbi:MAG: DUF4126 domain-containing protein [Saprospiraceae bacterium]
MELALSILLGICLSAATGMRIFLPALIASVATNQGYISPAEGFEWMASLPAIIAFATASVVELGAYYIPWVDNALDTVAGPGAILAGGLIATSFFQIESEALQWILGMIAGGSAAGGIQAGTTLLRGMSTASTGGIANPIVSTGKNLGAFFLSLLTILSPIVAIAMLLSIIIWGWRKYASWKTNRQIKKDQPIIS